MQKLPQEELLSALSLIKQDKEIDNQTALRIKKKLAEEFRGQLTYGIICPKNLVKMWEDYVYHYRMRAKVLPITRVINELPDLRRYRLIIIDESHNLRNREGKRYHAIHEYIQENESRCILLSATPYNKNYRDLTSQLRLFVQEDKDLGVRPERLKRRMNHRHRQRQKFCKTFPAPARGLWVSAEQIFSNALKAVDGHFSYR